MYILEPSVKRAIVTRLVNSLNPSTREKFFTVQREQVFTELQKHYSTVERQEIWDAAADVAAIAYRIYTEGNWKVLC